MRRTSTNQTLSVSLRPDTIAWLKDLAEAEHRSVSHQLQVILLEAAARQARAKPPGRPPQAARAAPLLQAIDDAKSA